MQPQDEAFRLVGRPGLVSGEGETPIAEDGPRQTEEAAVLRVTSAKIIKLDDYRDLELASPAPPPISSVYRDRAHSSPYLARALAGH